MNGDIFKNWVQDQLIPALHFDGSKTVVIMDNAPYHSVRFEKLLTKSCKKSKVQGYLIKNNINFDMAMPTKQLWDIIQPSLQNNEVKYEIDRLLHHHGIDVLRLPPYH
jgi:hypothetical protein